MDYPQISREIRKKVLKMMFDSQTAHLGGCLSCVDILNVLYFKILKIDPQDPLAEDRDRFLLSKGHGAAALYAALAQRGFFSEEILNGYCQDGGKLPGHSTRGCVPGVEVSTGSLGHGLPMGAGMAIAAKNGGKNYRIFVLMSDGECEEGSVWEAALFAAHHKLDNLVVIVDRNRWQAFGKTEKVLKLEPLEDKWNTFNWYVQRVNGHNFEELEEAFTNLSQEKPNIIIADTIKGKDCPSFEDKLESHYYNLNQQQYEETIKYLNQKK